MTIIVPHRIKRIETHATNKNIARFVCSCGVVGYSHPSRIHAAATDHVESEEAFPDYSFLGIPDPEER